MKITELLREDSEHPELPLAQIKADCSEFLSNPTFLVRGVTLKPGGFQEFAKMPIRQNRQSLSKRYMGTAIFNDAFHETFGEPDVRNRSLFVTNDVQVARKYGEVFFVLPVNGSKVAYSPGVADSIHHVGNSWYDFTDLLAQKMSQEEKNAFARKAMDLNLPQVPEDWFDQLLNTLKEPTQDFAEDYMSRVKDKMMTSYQVDPVSNIQPSSVPIEYMVFNADSYWMIHASAISPDVPFGYEHEAWEALIKRLK